MTPERRIADIRERLARATDDCAAWRAAGRGEKYLEAYSLVEALQAELAALPAFPHSTTSAEPGDRAQLMTDLSIASDGFAYHYGPFRYDRLDDALDFAKFERERATVRVTAAPAMRQPPSDEQRRVMADAHITYADGAYRLGEHRYERLDDALAYARLQRLQGIVAK